MIPTIRHLSKKASALYDRFLQLAQAKVTVHNRILVAQNSASDYVTQRAVQPASKQIPEDQVPAQIPSGPTGKFRNPYFLSDVGRYAGDPENFPWTPHMQKMYTTLKGILTAHNIPGFTVAYGSTYISPIRQGVSLVNHGNHAVIGDNGKLIWRKHDLGGRSGQNWLYINGKKINTSNFISYSITNRPVDQATFAGWIADMK